MESEWRHGLCTAQRTNILTLNNKKGSAVSCSQQSTRKRKREEKQANMHGGTKMKELDVL